MEKLEKDQLYQLLVSIKDRPWVFLGEKSLLALDNYITGYLNACSVLDPECFTIHWHDVFYRYVCDKYHVYKEKNTVFGVIRDCGYSDCEGLLIYFKLLGNFAEEKCNVKYATQPQLLQHGEVRAFRLDQTKMVDFVGKYVSEHSEDFFGVSSSGENCAYGYSLSLDNILTCVVFGDSSRLKYPENLPQINQLPIFSINDLIRYTVLFPEEDET